VNSGKQLVIGLQGFNPIRAEAKFLLELHLTFADGSKAIHGTNDDEWTAYDCSHVFGLGLSGFTGGDYKQPQETVNGQLYPHGWTTAGFNDSWMPAEEKPPFARRIAQKRTLAISISEQPVSLVSTAGSNGTFFFDFEQEIQANVAIEAVVPLELAGQVVKIQLAESLRPQGGLQFPSFTGNQFAATFVLGSGNISLETHEYMEFRYGTVRKMPFVEPVLH